MRRPVSSGMLYAPNDRRAQGAKKGDRLMRKTSTAARKGKKFLNHEELTIGLDLGDRFAYYCVLDQAGEVLIEDRLPTTKPGMEHVFGKFPRSRVAMETGTHSPWVSRQLTQLGHE